MESNIIFLPSIISAYDQWMLLGQSFLKGFAYHKGDYLCGKKLLDYLCEAFSADNPKAYLAELNGSFASIIRKDDVVLLVTDHIRSIPLFYSICNNCIYLSDSGDELYRNLGKSQSLNGHKIIEMAALGYLSGTDTLIKNIFQVANGSFVKVSDKGIEQQTYFSFVENRKVRRSRKEVQEKSQLLLEKAFKNTLSSLDCYSKIAVPLSGGYDSRLIACLCKSFGLENVVCYTYGSPESFEVKISRQVAETLGYKWHFVEYTEETWKECLDSEDFQRYFHYAGNLN